MTSPSDDTDTTTEVQDTPPPVPPARKPVAIEIAREAHALATDLAERLDQLRTGGGERTFSPATEPLSALDRELLDELPKASNELAELNRKVSVLQGRSTEVLDAVSEVDTRHTANVHNVVQALQALEDRFAALPQTVELTPVATNVPMVYGAVLDVMRMVTELGKDGRVQGGGAGNYQYRSIDAAMDAVGTAMRQVGVIFSTQVLGCDATTNVLREKVAVKGKPDEYRDRLWTTVRATVRYTFISPDDGSTHSIEMVGEGRDLGDKATSKAVAMAFKYALLHGLCIPIEGLPESDGHNPVMDVDGGRAQQAPPEQASQAQPERPKMTREETVASLANALDDLANWPLADQRVRYANITAAVKKWGLEDDPIPGQGNYPLRALVQTVAGTIPGLVKEPTPEADAGPWADAGPGQHADPSQYA
jgi:hypothetical protein